MREGRAWISGGVRDSAPWLTMFDARSYEPMDTFDCSSFGPAMAISAMAWPQQVCVQLCLRWCCSCSITAAAVRLAAPFTSGAA